MLLQLPCDGDKISPRIPPADRDCDVGWWSLQAFLLFEESIPDSAAERAALSSIVGALHGCRIFPPESRSTLVHKATGYSAKLLRKADQCRAVLACSHLHWQASPARSAILHRCAGACASPLAAFCSDSLMCRSVQHGCWEAILLDSALNAHVLAMWVE